MRILPAEIRNKLLERFQVESKDAKPTLRVVATQSTVNTLLTEDIHKDVAAGFGDVAIRQLPGESTPSLAYAIGIDSGVANIYERSFPTDLESPWVWNWTLGAAIDVAIEFNGEWTINAKTRCYELITEETPYIFFTDAAGTLYFQKWQDEATRIPLAKNVEQISVCRAWKSNLDVGVDQGLVIGYLREGGVYYRTYAEQEGGAILWEEERQVTELGTANTTLALFRTNDYRLGLVTENAGQIQYVLSYRTYAGPAMPAEYADVQPRNARVWMIPPTRYYPVTTERANVDPGFVYLMTHPASATLEISEVARMDERNLLFTFSQDIGGEILSSISISPERAILSATIQSGNEVLVTLSEDMSRVTPFDLTITNCRSGYWIVDGMKMALETLTIHADGAPNEGVEEESVMITTSGTVLLITANKFYPVTSEMAVVTGSGSVTLTPVDVIPI
jgi:hypothetical protein